MTGLAGQVAVLAEELEAGCEMVERVTNLHGGSGRCPHEGKQHGPQSPPTTHRVTAGCLEGQHLVQTRALERGGRVAALALSAVLPQVDVVLLVAGQARRIQLYFVRRLFVAARANELRVSAGECESRLLAVVEFPQTPAVRRMALGACNAQRAFVNVISLVTIDAPESRATILSGGVALLA